MKDSSISEIILVGIIYMLYEDDHCIYKSCFFRA